MSDGNGDKPDLRLLHMKPADELQKSVETMRRTIPYLLELYEITAIAHKRKFDELMKAGFTESQALELCKTLT